MKIIPILCSIVGIVALTACSDSIEQMKQVAEGAKQASEGLQNYAEEIKKDQEAAEERRAKGDTVAMPYKDLQKYLPTSIPGYTGGEPSGESVDIPGGSFSSASVVFTKDSESGGNTGKIEIKLMDFAGSMAGFTTYTALLKMGIKVENDRERSQTVDLGMENIGCYEKFNKKRNSVELIYGLGARFVLSIHATEQEDTDLARSVAEDRMPIQELAEL